MDNIQENQKELEQAVLILNFKVFGIAFGIVAGLFVFIATNWLILKGGSTGEDGAVVLGPHMQLLGNFFIGYSVTFVGSLIGFFYGFSLGTLFGSAIATIYTILVRYRRR